MLEWILILVVAMLAVLGFLFLLHNTPGSGGGVVGKTSSKLKKEGKAGKERESSPEKGRNIKKNKDNKKSSKKPPVQEEDGVALRNFKIVDAREDKDEDVLELLKPVQGRTRSSSPKQDLKKKLEKVLPTPKQIEKDLQQGFVLVTKKGPPQLSPEQRLERSESRRQEKKDKEKEEEEQRQRQKKAMERKLRGNSPPSQPSQEIKPNPTPALTEFRAKKEEVKVKKPKTEPAKIKMYTTPKNEGEPPRIWTSIGAPQSSEGMEEQDNADYPRL